MDQSEFEVGSAARYWLVATIQAVFIFVALAIAVMLVSGSFKDPLSVVFLAIWSIGVLLIGIGHQNAANVAIVESGLLVRRPFRTEIVPWNDIVGIKYSVWQSPLLVITVKSHGKWTREKQIHVPYSSSSALSADWRTGIKTALGTVPPAVLRFKEEVDRRQASSGTSIPSPQ